MDAQQQGVRTIDVKSSVIEAIGNTPLIELGRITAGYPGRVLMKLEYLNPGLSKKDRPALRLIDAAESRGELEPGQTVLELTSGNMGTGLAIVCAVRGYPFVAVMSRGNSRERRLMMQALGAEVVLVDQAQGSRPGEVTGDDLAIVEAAARQLAIERNAFRADQFILPGNAASHFDGTAAEIWRQSGGTMTAFCDFAGSGGTIAGCARYFKQVDPRVKCFVVEPADAAALSGATQIGGKHPIQGGGYAMPHLTQLDSIDLDGVLTVSSDSAIECMRRLAREEGIFAGPSTGANLSAALNLLEGSMPDATVAIIAADSGLKYGSTALWQ